MRQLIIARVITQPPYCFSSLSVDFSQRNYPTTILFRFLLISETTIRTVNRENAYFPIRRSVQIWYFRARAAGYLDVATISRHGTVHRHYTSLCARNRRTKECDSREEREREEDEIRKRIVRTRMYHRDATTWCIMHRYSFAMVHTFDNETQGRSTFQASQEPSSLARHRDFTRLSLSLSLSGENKMI